MPDPLDKRYPVEIQDTWHELYNDVVWLHGSWIIYRQLYGKSECRVNLLNESAGTVSALLQDVLLGSVQLELSKLSDPPRSVGKDNLSLYQLHATLEQSGHVVIADQVAPLIASFKAKCEPARKRRNKAIAHNDLSTRRAAVPLNGPSREEVEKALLALRAVMNCVEVHFTQSQTAFEHLRTEADGDSLIKRLLEAKRYRELVAEGSIPRTDWRGRYPNGL